MTTQMPQRCPTDITSGHFCTFDNLLETNFSVLQKTIWANIVHIVRQGDKKVCGGCRKRQMTLRVPSWAGALCVCGNAIQGDNSTLTAHDGIHDWWSSIAASSIFSCNENKIHLFLPLCLLKSMWETSPSTLTRARCGRLMYFSICLPSSLTPSLRLSAGQRGMNSSLAVDAKTDRGSELLLLFDCYRNMAQSLKECSANARAISQFNSQETIPVWYTSKRRASSPVVWLNACK